MASTFSPSLGLELMATGEKNGTWGSITNENWELAEEAISGVLALSMGDTNVTLTSTQGATNQARHMVLSVTGAHTGVRVITAPSAEKVYVIRNGTTGGFDIQIKTSAGAAVNIPAGVVAVVYCDGVDFRVANYSGSTTLTALGTTTLAANKLPYYTSSSAATTTDLSAFGRQLIDDADAATARSTLGLAIGSNVQAFSSVLSIYAGISPSANMQTYLACSTYADMRTALSLSNVENKSSATIRGEISAANVNTALGKTAARVNSGASTNSGLISWGTGAPGSLAEGEIYLRYS